MKLMQDVMNTIKCYLLLNVHELKPNVFDDSICYPPVKKTKDNCMQASTKETHDLR